MGSTIIHLMGPTCAGKSTLIERMCAISKDVHPVEVGKMLRARHGEDHFKGQAAPLHTQGEAWELYLQGVRAGIAANKAIILVDGQPRDVQQARDIIGLWKAPHRSTFLLIHADHEERERRARGGRVGASLELAVKRLDNDYRNCYVVMVELARANEVLRVIDTTSLGDAKALAEQMLVEYGPGTP